MTNDRPSVLTATLGRLGVVPLVLRVVVAVMVATAIAATAMPAWDAPDGYVVIAVFAGVCYVAAPDSGSGVVFVAALAVTWLTGAPGNVGPAVVVAALALLVGHVAAALAGSMPVTAHTDVAMALRWARPTGVIAAGVLATAALLALLDRWSLPGSVLVTVAAVAALSAAVWRWSAVDGSR
jgi:hypothetical protein